MANEQDIDRLLSGKEKWNKWAQEKLDEKKALIDDGIWVSKNSATKSNMETENWRKSAVLKFDHVVFEREVDCRGFIFPHVTDFAYSRFNSGTSFDGAIFYDDSDFSGTIFTDTAWFRNVIFQKNASFYYSVFEGGLQFDHAVFKGNAGFMEAKFTGEAMFPGVVFSSQVILNGATFDKTAYFRAAVFSGKLYMVRATFSGQALFSDVKFSGQSSFLGTTFCELADFDRAIFSGSVVTFNECTFERAANFREAKFVPIDTLEAVVSFGAANSKSEFSLANAAFDVAPDFTQMNFLRAPRMDHMKVAKAIPFQFEGNADRASCYRNLKRLAHENHDHLKEREFFVDETLERRGNADKKWGVDYCFSFAYELFSNFGKSYLRPLVWMLAGYLLFGVCYLLLAEFDAHQNCGYDIWICIEKSLLLSFYNQIPLISPPTVGYFEVISAYMYNSKNFPHEVMVLILLQKLYGTLFVFLFLFAVRNHFKIK